MYYFEFSFVTLRKKHYRPVRARRKPFNIGMNIFSIFQEFYMLDKVLFYMLFQMTYT
jgi:hypothetical protein